MNKYDRYRMELMRLSNNIQFYKQKISLCQASNARIFYEQLLAKEARRFQDLQLEYQRLDLRPWQVFYQEQGREETQESEESEELNELVESVASADLGRLSEDDMDLDQEEANQSNQDDIQSEIEQIDKLSTEQTDQLNQENPNQEDPNQENPNQEDPNQEDPNQEDPNQEDPIQVSIAPVQQSQQVPNQKSVAPVQPSQQNPNQKSAAPVQPSQQEPVTSDQKVYTIEELGKYNGSGGQPAYVAVNGIVYDVSIEKRWGGGTHFSLFAGKNLTTNFNTCHGGDIEVLRNLPKVGIIKQ